MLADATTRCWSTRNALIATNKVVVFEIDVQGPERVERLMYVHQLVETLKRDAPAARPTGKS
jgi:hypothetical protein